MTNLIELSSTSANSPIKTPLQQRSTCVVCDYEFDNQDCNVAFFPCNVRAFKHEKFPVWRCPNCQSIHCLDIVDLSNYYAQYPYAESKLDIFFKLYYHGLTRKLRPYGFLKHKKILDYGCGNGLFIEYLKTKKFTDCYGYDPYGKEKEFGDRNILNNAPFDFIFLQDVIEHIEDPKALLRELDSLLSEEGYVMIGTPNAANIDLNQPDLSDFYNSVHVPYHLHIFTLESLMSLVKEFGWELVNFSDRPFSDTQWPGLNTRTWNHYQRLCDGTLNTIFEPIKIGKALRSYQWFFYVIAGYYLSYHTEMTLLLKKSSSNSGKR